MGNRFNVKKELGKLYQSLAELLEPHKGKPEYLSNTSFEVIKLMIEIAKIIKS